MHSGSPLKFYFSAFHIQDSYIWLMQHACYNAHKNILNYQRKTDLYFITPRTLSVTQEDLVVMEAKGQNSFPFCDECPSARYSAASPSVVLLDNIHYGWQTMADDTLALLSCFYVSGVQVWHFSIRSSSLRCNRPVRETHSMNSYFKCC